MTRLLIVDDDKAICQVYGEIFGREYGWETTCAETIREALATLPVCRPDVILLDMILADGDATQFLVALTLHPQWPRIPIVLASGTVNQAAEEALQTRASPLGVSAVVAKADGVAKVTATVVAAVDRGVGTRRRAWT